ncbi:hypothetical protein KUTeg_002842 [Tegillarca granosa]|uniref:Uncharacterized protein n=2 Tax=Tegillarca granosa TaxID=220873 RepID=A0ABQ9FS88_TEGGR|nr:hypothetical protein KUTeg_002842 [Tegillarca granosa]
MYDFELPMLMDSSTINYGIHLDVAVIERHFFSQDVEASDYFVSGDHLLLVSEASYGCPSNKGRCIKACKAKRFTSGYCRGSTCRCVGKVCPRYRQLCKLSCFRKGYKRGYCNGTRCQCYSRACPTTSRYCSLSCRLDRRYDYGRCVGSQCRCYKRSG